MSHLCEVPGTHREPRILEVVRLRLARPCSHSLAPGLRPGVAIKVLSLVQLIELLRVVGHFAHVCGALCKLQEFEQDTQTGEFVWCWMEVVVLCIVHLTDTPLKAHGHHRFWVLDCENLQPLSTRLHRYLEAKHGL